MFFTTVVTVFWCTLLHSLIRPLEVLGDKPNSGACLDNREEFGYALVGHDLRSVHADTFARCFFVCTLDERCQSVTYLGNEKNCKMNKETKKSRPEDFVENPAATYMDNNFRAKKGSKSLVPGLSCKDIVTSGDAQGDGEYWIDPTASGDPFTVFCGMTTDEGGWTLISRFHMNDANSVNDVAIWSNSYKEILTTYNSNKQYLLRNGFNQLKIDMGFTQIRLYCFKKERGRVFHIMTNKNTSGVNVVEFFTDSDTIPEACGSFTRLPDDNSTLATNCANWGYPNTNLWGHNSNINDKRLFTRPIVWTSTHYYTLTGKILTCDDKLKDLPMSLGDTWKIFVR